MRIPSISRGWGILILWQPWTTPKGRTVVRLLPASFRVFERKWTRGVIKATVTSFGKWIDSKKTLFQEIRKNLGEVSFKCERALFAEVGTPEIKKKEKATHAEEV